MSTSARLGLKESASRTPTPSTPCPFSSPPMNQSTNSMTRNSNDYDRHKRDSLAKQKKGAAHWKPELASDSEEAVRADRAAKGSAEDLKHLQDRTKRAAEETAKAGTSMKDNM